jgi:hypothetical protein
MPDTAPTKPVQTPEDPPVAPDEQGNDDGDSEGGKTIEVEADPNKWVYPEGMSYSEESAPKVESADDAKPEPKSATSGGSKKASGGVVSPDLQKKAESAAKAERKP